MAKIPTPYTTGDIDSVDSSNTGVNRIEQDTTVRIQQDGTVRVLQDTVITPKHPSEWDSL